jgi:gliding motility-associated-like protein
MNKISLCFLLLLLPVSLLAQRFYISSTSGSIKKANLSSAGVNTVTLSSCNPGTDAIALNRDTMYYSSKLDIYKTIRTGNQFLNCQYLLSLPYQPTSLTVDSAGIIFAASEQYLFSIDPVFKVVKYIGEMPYISAGDLVFYKHQLFMASTQGIVKINMDTTMKSQLIIPLQAANIYGMAILSSDCKTNKVYGFSKTLAGTEMMELDLDNYHASPTIATFQDLVNDAASDAETGLVADIQLEELKVESVCNVSNKANLQVIADAGFVPYNYSLNGGTPNTTGLFPNLDPGTYAVSIFTAGDCRIDTTVVIPVFTFTKPTIRVHNQVQTCVQPAKVWFDVTGTTPVKIQQNSSAYSSDHVFENLQPGDYAFDFTDQNHCVLETIKLTVKHEGTCDGLYFPSAFTPNNDGLNETFKAAYNFAVTGYELVIVNRWGQVVFKTTDISKGWNGEVNGKKQAAGVYIYRVSCKLNGSDLMQKGTITLIR